jgi:hypothetical protein
MAVNTLVTGLIVFKIFKVFLEVGRTLGTTGDTKVRHIIFVIIESGMALLAIQVLRLVIPFVSTSIYNTDDFLIATNEMLNVIIRSVHLHFFVLLITFTWLGHHTNNNFGAGLIEIVLRRQRILQGSCQKPSESSSF